MFFFNDTATTEIYTFSLHDALPIWNTSLKWVRDMRAAGWWDDRIVGGFMSYWLYQHLGNLSPSHLAEDDVYARVRAAEDRKSTRLNSSHANISYAVFCLTKNISPSL